MPTFDEDIYKAQRAAQERDDLELQQQEPSPVQPGAPFDVARGVYGSSDEAIISAIEDSQPFDKIQEIDPQTGEPINSGTYELDPQTGKPMTGPVLREAPAMTIIQKIKDYIGLNRQPKTTPLQLEAVRENVRPYDVRQDVFGTGRVEEFRRVVARGMAGATFGASDLARGMLGDTESPETAPGAFLGAGAELSGFLYGGPMKLAGALTGGWAAPTASGLRATAKVLAHGGATLGIASGLSAALPAFMKDDELSQMALDIGESAGMGAIIGAIYPAGGFIENKAVRMAVTLAVMDKIRAGTHEWFTIDDVAKGIHDGTIDPKELGEASFGYLMDMYFALKVPTMRGPLSKIDNPVAKEVVKQSEKEVEQAVVNIGQQRQEADKKGQPILEKTLTGEAPAQPITNPDVEADLLADLPPRTDVPRGTGDLIAEARAGAEQPKEPWEMTYKQWLKYDAEQKGEDIQAPTEEGRDWHRDQVEKALDAGVPIDHEVLKEYPELVPKDVTPKNKQIEFFKGSETMQAGTRPIIARQPGEGEFFAPLDTTEQQTLLEPKTVTERKAPEVDPAKDSVVNFLKKSGGLDYNKESMKAELDRLFPKEAGGKGIGLINKKGNGMTLDRALTALKEEGYFGEDATINDLLAAIENELYRGIKTYSAAHDFDYELSLEEMEMMERAREGGEVGAVTFGFGQGEARRAGRVMDRELLTRTRNEASLEYKRTWGDKLLDMFPWLRDPRRYFQNTRVGADFIQKVIDLEQVFRRGSQLAESEVDKVFGPHSTIMKQWQGEFQKMSERVGKALDGRLNISALTEGELKAYRRLRRILNFFARAFKLPPDGRLSDYFPHIFRGQYMIYYRDPKDGMEKIIPGGFADTKQEAYKKAQAYIDMLPPAEQGSAKGKLTIDETYRPELMADAVNQLSFSKLMKLRDAIMHGKTIEEQIRLAKDMTRGQRPAVAFRHLMKRTANMEGFESDSYKVLKLYVRGAVRKLYFDRILPELEKSIEQLPEHQKAWANSLVEYMKGMPSTTDNTVDRWIKEMGWDMKPQTVSRVTNAINRYFYVAKLGLGNISGAAGNALTLFAVAPVKIGPKATAEGIYLYLKSLKDPRLQKILQKDGPPKMRFGDTELGIGGKVASAAEKTALPFQMVEDMTHGAVFFGARNKFIRMELERQGKTLDEMTNQEKSALYDKAARYGRDKDMETQIPQTKATRSPMFRDPVVRSALLFKSYMFKMAESLAHMTVKEKVMFTAMALSLGGPFAIPGLRYMAQRDQKIAEILDWINEHMNVPRMLGFDFSGDVGVGFIPEDWRSTMGPPGQIASEGGKAVMQMATGESTEEEKSRILKLLQPAFPARSLKAWDMYTTGVTRDERGRPVIETTPADTFAYLLLGGRSKAAADTYEKNRRFIVQEQKEQNEREELLDRFVMAREDADQEAMKKVVVDIGKHNQTYGPLLGITITPEMISNAILASKLTKEQRLLLSNPRKGAAFDRFMK